MLRTKRTKCIPYNKLDMQMEAKLAESKGTPDILGTVEAIVCDMFIPSDTAQPFLGCECDEADQGP